MEQTLFNAMKERRTFYAIGKELVATEEKTLDLIRHAVLYTPSSFNSQSARVIVLLGGEHEKLWNITKDILKEIVPPEHFAPTEEKIDSFKNGAGTVLFFEDQNTVTALQKQFSLYQDNFPIWSLESSGMLQYGVWMLLESEGYGVSLQHYNPLIDAKVREAWKVPESWKLLGEMPFGKPLAQPETKSFLPLEDRIKIYR